MFYKYWEEAETWTAGNEIGLPNGEILTKDNKKEVDGWKWHDTPPAEYLQWKFEQDETRQA